MTDVRDIVQASLREIGVLAAGEAAAYADGNDALLALNRMLDAGGVDRLDIYNTNRTTFALVADQAEYLLGAAPDQEADTTDGFDSGWVSVPPDWNQIITGTGTITNDDVTFQAGGHSLKLSGGAAGTAAVYRDFVVASGSEATISAWLMSDFTANGFVSVRNQTTNNYLKSDGTWVLSGDSVFTAPAGIVFVLSTKTFTVESAAVVGAETCTLRVRLRNDLALFNSWFDTFEFESEGLVCGLPRPVFLDHANLVDVSQDPPIEFPLRVLTEDEWAGISIKEMPSTRPSAVYYNPTFPAGTLSLWPIPTSDDLEIALYVPTPVPRFTALSDTFTLPPGYEEMLVTNLALRLCPSYGVTPNPVLVKLASDSMAAVKRVNRRKADLTFPAGSLIGNQYPTRYNIRQG